jgi:hypothetical protein
MGRACSTHVGGKKCSVSTCINFTESFFVPNIVRDTKYAYTLLTSRRLGLYLCNVYLTKCNEQILYVCVQYRSTVILLTLICEQYIFVQ